MNKSNLPPGGKMSEYSFEGQSVMITGAGGNLGSAVTRKFFSAGANLILVDFSNEKLTRVFPELIQSGQHVIAQGVDINNEDDLDVIISDAMDKFGRLDVLVNTIGGYQGGFPLYETPDETWDMLFTLNVRPVYSLAKVVVPIMKEAQSGKIINLAARMALKGSSNNAAYSAAKSAVIRLTESMAAELMNDGVNVNCILPGTIDTPQNRASTPSADYSRWVTPDAIADVIMFLASESARAISGASIPVYGRS
jgi:NAD(P)-dependent dehydrogenase (short-subunit alcohol dehydrogenase family)